MFVYAEPAKAQLGIVNQVINSAIHLQQQQQAAEAQRRAHERSDRERSRAAEREKQSEQKKQAAEKAEVEKQAKLEKVRLPAEQLMEEVSDFIKANPGHPKIIPYAEGVAALGKALKAGNPGAIEKQTAALSAQMQKDPKFQEFAQQRAVQRREQNARELVEVVKAAQTQRTFLVGFIAQNPMANGVDTLLPLVKSLDEALQQPALETIKPVTVQAEAAIRQAGLRTSYLNALAAAPVTAAAAGAAPQTVAIAPPAGAAPASDTLSNSLTEKNRFLLDGDVNDIVFLYNASSSAPHVLKNLKGDVVFEKSTATICVFQREVDLPSANIARQTLAPFSLETISIDAKPCAAEKLRAFDVIMVRRASVFRGDAVSSHSLLQQIELGALAQLLTVSNADLVSRSEQSARLAAEIRGQSRAGFGLLVLANNSATLCAVVSEDVPAQEQVLSSHRASIRAEFSAAPQISFMELDAAFAGVKRERCAAVYADAANLKSLMDALDRDGTRFQIAPFWVAPDEVARAKDTIATGLAEAQTRNYERQRSQSEAVTIAALREADDARDRNVIQAKLREKNGAKAQATANIIGNEVKDGVNGKGGSARVQYAGFFEWLDDKRRDRWDVFALNTTLFEYGMANWKGRSLEIGAVQIDIRLRNQVLGEYRDHCFIFTKMFDTEFQTSRDAVVIECKKDAQIAAWKTTRDFKSLWNAE